MTVEKVPFVEAEMGCSGMGEMGDGRGWGFLGILVFPFLLGTEKGIDVLGCSIFCGEVVVKSSMG